MDNSQNKIVKTAGLMFLLSLFLPMLNWVLVNSKFIVADNASATIQKILANETLFRLGILNDLVAAVIGLVLALTLYLLLKSVSKPLAGLAFFLKVIEVVLMAVIALGNFAALLVLNPLASPAGPDAGQVLSLLGHFFSTRMPLAAVPMLFLGLDFMVFFTLLYQSQYVPRLLAGFGVLAYALILTYALLTLVFPNYAAIVIIQTVCWAPSCVFELVIGVWLLVKGISPKVSPAAG